MAQQQRRAMIGVAMTKPGLGRLATAQASMSDEPSGKPKPLLIGHKRKGPSATEIVSQALVAQSQKRRKSYSAQMFRKMAKAEQAELKPADAPLSRDALIAGKPLLARGLTFDLAVDLTLTKRP
jgi:hypothetical protein